MSVATYRSDLAALLLNPAQLDDLKLFDYQQRILETVWNQNPEPPFSESNCWNGFTRAKLRLEDSDVPNISEAHVEFLDMNIAGAGKEAACR